MSKYLHFRLYKDTGKTKVWIIQSKKSGDPLGVIKWIPEWRKYVLYPSPDTAFDSACLLEICGFMDGEMSKRK